MDIRHLRTFLQVAETGSITKAAGRLRIAQPALSRQINALEQELETALFLRHGRGMRLTVAGEFLHKRTINLLRQFEEIKADVLSHSGLLQGEVSLGMPPTVAAVLAGVAAETFSRDYPRVQLHLVSGFSNFVLDWLIRGEIDVAILFDTHLPKGLRIKPLLQENLVFVAAPEVDLAPNTPITFEQAAKNTLILPSLQHSLRILLDEIATKKDLKLDVAIEADGFMMLIDLVIRGLGCTFLPRSAIQIELAAGRLIAAPVIDPKITHGLVLALPTDRPISNAVNKFSEVLHQVITQMAETGNWTGEDI